jgi:alpha-beta hydrolase superfamily lysophospholipase
LSPFGPGIAVAALLFIVVGLDRFANRVVRPAYRPFERTVPDLGMPHEDLTIRSGDHDLPAWLLRPSQAQPYEPLLLLAHGWGANYSTVLRLAEPLAARGHEVLLFDVRGHGRSEPVPYVTIRHFRDDLLAVTRYAARRFPDRQLVLIGHSLGGAAGVLAAADGAPVDGLVLIAAPSDVLRVTAEFLVDQGMPGNLLVALLRPFFWRRVGSSFRRLTPSRRIREVDLPLLILQPENDARVYRAHAERLSAAAGRPYHLIEGYEHTDVLEAPETLHLIEAFLEEV